MALPDHVTGDYAMRAVATCLFALLTAWAVAADVIPHAQDKPPNEPRDPCPTGSSSMSSPASPIS
jgi:hypothetical protein